MIQPVEIPLSAYIGPDYFDDWDFFDGPNPYDFTGWTQFSFIVGPIRLTEGSGLTVDRTGGVVYITIGRDVTATQRPGTASYVLSALDADNVLSFMMLGVFEWKRGIA